MHRFILFWYIELYNWENKQTPSGQSGITAIWINCLVLILVYPADMKFSLQDILYNLSNLMYNSIIYTNILKTCKEKWDISY